MGNQAPCSDFSARWARGQSRCLVKTKILRLGFPAPAQTRGSPPSLRMTAPIGDPWKSVKSVKSVVKLLGP